MKTRVLKRGHLLYILFKTNKKKLTKYKITVLNKSLSFPLVLYVACHVHRRSLRCPELGQGNEMKVKAGDEGEGEEAGRAVKMIQAAILPTWYLSIGSSCCSWLSRKAWYSFSNFFSFLVGT